MKNFFDKTLNSVKSAFKKDEVLGIEFLKACAVGNLTGMKMLLAKNVDPNYQNPENKKTALHLAAEKNDLPIIQFLLENGARGDIKDSTANTPLLHSVEKNQQRAIKALCEKRDSNGINEANFSGETALIVALRVKQFKVAKFLIDNGADTTIALRKALISEDDEQLNWLCLNGANPNIFDTTGATPLSRAVQDGNVQNVLKWISRGADVNVTEGNGKLIRIAGWTPLMISIDLGRKEITAILLGNPKINIGVTVGADTSALTIAIGKGDYEIAVRLKQSGATIPEILSEGKSLLMLAAQSKNLRLLKLVYEWQPEKINVQDKKGWPPLMYAIKANSSDLVEFLLNKGADRELHSTEYKFNAQRIAENQRSVVPATAYHLQIELDKIMQLLKPDDTFTNS